MCFSAVVAMLMFGGMVVGSIANFKGFHSWLPIAPFELVIPAGCSPHTLNRSGFSAPDGFRTGVEGSARGIASARALICSGASPNEQYPLKKQSFPSALWVSFGKKEKT